MIPGLDAACVSSLVRACIRAPAGFTFAICDLAGIEARVNAWCAGDEGALALFRKEGHPPGFECDGCKLCDPYCRVASVLFERDVTKHNKLERGIGKRCELGCGYGMGGPKFEATVVKYGGDWSKTPVTPKQCVDAWRELHAPIVLSWKAYQRAARIAANGGTESAGPVTFAAFDGGVLCELPSGRCLVYWDMRDTEDGLVYSGAKNGREIDVRTYGGALCENIVQAISRDLLARALVTCEREGLPVVFHTHDEIVAEVPRTHGARELARLRDIMIDVPPWATGCPIDADGFTAERYKK